MAKVWIAIIALTALAWLYLLAGAGMGMSAMDMGGGQVMPRAPVWSLPYAARVFAMWAVMMIAMMLPGAAPTIVSFAKEAQQTRPTSGFLGAMQFAAGYLMVWTAFSVAATSLQWALDADHLLNDSMALRSATGGAVLLMAAGFYQLTTFKQASLRRCCAPLDRFRNQRRHGTSAMMRAGFSYGLSCLGCSALLMSLLFVGGVMNTVWIALITLWVLAEKNLSWGARAARIGAGGLIGWAAISLVMVRR